MTARRDRKRKRSPEWIRLGELLAHRRGELDARYDGHGGRLAFAKDVGINLRRLQDLENNVRENFKPVSLRDEIAPAYKVSYGSVRAVLDEGGDLAALPGTPPHKPPRSLRAEPQHPPLAVVPSPPDDAGYLLRGDGDLFPGVGPELKARALPYYREIEARVLAAAMAEAGQHGIGIGEALATIPAGADVFPDMERERAWWDAVRKQGLASGPYTVWKLAQVIAMTQATTPAEQNGDAEQPRGQNGDAGGAGLAARRSCCRSAPTRGSVSCMSL